MPCPDWNDAWIARIYDELDPAEEPVLQAHLAACPACRQTLDALGATRAVLAAAVPPVPLAPRVLVLPGRPGRGIAWGLAAGAVAATLVLALAPRPGDPGAGAPVLPGAPAIAAAPTAAPEALAEQVSDLAQRLARLEAGGAEPALTPAQLRDELARFERRLNRDRANELDYLMRTITASELRTGAYIDQTRDALDLLASRAEPGLVAD